MSLPEEALYGKKNAAYDQAAKKVLSQKKILAFILKRTVKEFENESIQDIMTKYIEGKPDINQVPVYPDETNLGIEAIHGDNAEDGSISEGMVRYDILFRALAPKTNDPITLIINIEAQNKSNPGYTLLKRATYYASRLISSQRGREFHGDEYDNIKKVYTIWICMNAPKEAGNSINRYQMTEERLHGRYHARQDNYDLIIVIMLYLGNRKTQDSLMEMLRIIFKERASAYVKKKQLEEEYGIRLTEDETKELSNMCNLSEGVFEEGIRIGKKGEHERTMVDNINSLMKTMGLSLSQAMHALQIPQDEASRYQKLIKKH